MVVHVGCELGISYWVEHALRELENRVLREVIESGREREIITRMGEKTGQ
jgi:hypothetical protein